MVYSTTWNSWIIYNGNNIFPAKQIFMNSLDESLLRNRIDRVKKEKQFFHITKIDNSIFYATIDYFKNIWANWANIPLTTLMISSPWEVYAWKTLDYTTDTLPIEIPSRFWNNRRVFLAESSQFYLELYLLIEWLEKVFSIYNSFRKEKSDITHLTEFQHIEFEWVVSYEENIKTFIGLYEHIFEYLVKNNKEDLLFFLSEEKLQQKIGVIKRWPIRISFKDALDLLYKATNDNKYKEFSLKNFWTWEEIKLTELMGWNVIIEEFPLLQIPFYHEIATHEIAWVPVAKNADFILFGYRETIGSWQRIKNKDVLLEKAKIFNLPFDDYLPYLTSRDYNDYKVTSWFWLGWQRLTQWITDQPYIYEATVFPRTHLIPNP